MLHCVRYLRCAWANLDGFTKQRVKVEVYAPRLTLFAVSMKPATTRVIARINCCCDQPWDSNKNWISHI